MSEQSRALPDRPNLRFLKVEAKRRLATGEFAGLHDAQLGIAREHGFSSWTALKLAVEGDPTPALSQVRWLVARFADARGPEWTAPDESEIRAHFHDRFLTAIPLEQLITTLRALALPQPAELVVKHASPTYVRAQLGDLRIEASAEAEPPQRFEALRIYPLGDRVTDRRVADPRTAVAGDVPVRAIELAGTSLAELGLPGLILAGGTEPWVLAHGWADVARDEPMRVDHRFPAYGITKLITSTVVLRLVATGRVDLDAPANSYLRSIRLADDAVTVKEILTHTGGVVGPSAQVVAVEQRGTFKPSNAGYAVLGQLVADVTGSSFPDVAGDLVLTPLRMRDSSFPANVPDAGAMRGHQLAEDGTFERTQQAVYEPAAAGGLWTTAADLLRFGNGWSTLLPAELAADAIRPHAAQRIPGADVGLGWLCNTAEGVYGHSGAGPGSASSLIVRAETGAVTVAVTNRLVPIEPVNAALSRPI